MTTPSSQKVAYQILLGFEKSFRRYSVITSQARQYFEQDQPLAMRALIKQRIDIYENVLAETISEIYSQVDPHLQSKKFWHQLKEKYQRQLDEHPQYELAETFYNSVVGRIFKHQKIDDEIMFVLPRRCFLAGQLRNRVVNSFDTDAPIKTIFQRIFSHYRFNVALEDYQRDISRLVRYLKREFGKVELAAVTKIEILKPVFYRDRAAYLVGRMCFANKSLPFVIALLLNEKKEMFVDTLLTRKRDLSVLFGFARSYFLVDTAHPAETVAFLQQLLPNKKNFELYIALGYVKHGKTVFYRNFLQHLERSEDQFESAPGIKGMVMAVFHLPSYGVVFKIIKDEFPESKKISRQHVKDCYNMVKVHDRAGRMADTHEYVNFRLPLHRVSKTLLDELTEVANNSIEIKDQELVIKHLYIERKMIPLNLYLEQTDSTSKIENIINELGLTIKQIAAANIFPGDMLHKNFGVTRHGRVIFYDYDEICYMAQRNFRYLPKSDDPYALDTLSVAPDDVFPEQFEHFIVGKKLHKEMLKRNHPELMQPGFWQELQSNIAKGSIPYIQPYPSAHKFQYYFKP